MCQESYRHHQFSKHLKSKPFHRCPPKHFHRQCAKNFTDIISLANTWQANMSTQTFSQTICQESYRDHQFSYRVPYEADRSWPGPSGWRTVTPPHCPPDWCKLVSAHSPADSSARFCGKGWWFHPLCQVGSGRTRSGCSWTGWTGSGIVSPRCGWPQWAVWPGCGSSR